jgi:hypothetical protein
MIEVNETCTIASNPGRYCVLKISGRLAYVKRLKGQVDDRPYYIGRAWVELAAIKRTGS